MRIRRCLWTSNVRMSVDDPLFSSAMAVQNFFSLIIFRSASLPRRALNFSRDITRKLHVLGAVAINFLHIKVFDVKNFLRPDVRTSRCRKQQFLERGATSQSILRKVLGLQAPTLEFWTSWSWWGYHPARPTKLFYVHQKDFTFHDFQIDVRRLPLLSNVVGRRCVGTSGRPDVGTVGCLDVRTYGRRDVGHPNVRTSGCPDVGTSGPCTPEPSLFFRVYFQKNRVYFEFLHLYMASLFLKNKLASDRVYFFEINSLRTEFIHTEPSLFFEENRVYF